jgi:hypothetical protein
MKEALRSAFPNDFGAPFVYCSISFRIVELPVVRKTKMTLSPSVPRSSAEDILDPIAGIAPAPLLPGEKREDYDRLGQRVVAVAEPRDFIEELLARDVIDLSWEVFRLRRLKAGILRTSASEGVRRILSIVDFGRAFGRINRQNFPGSWAAGDPAKRKEFDTILEKVGLTMDDDPAEALSSKMDAFERCDHTLASAEARRNIALREISRHREAFGAAVRRAIDEVEDAEFRDVETAPSRVHRSNDVRSATAPIGLTQSRAPDLRLRQGRLGRRKMHCGTA